MAVEMLELEALPRKKISEMRNALAAFAKDLDNRGSVAITNHERIEMVLVSAKQYQRIQSVVAGVDKKDEAVLAKLANAFDHRVAAMNAQGAADRFDAAFTTTEWEDDGPIAGANF